MNTPITRNGDPSIQKGFSDYLESQEKEKDPIGALFPSENHFTSKHAADRENLRNFQRF